MATTIQNSLKSISAYPIPLNTLQDIAEERGIDIGGDVTLAVKASGAFQLAKADVFYWLSIAPNVSQAGISYTFSDSDRLNFKRRANAIYRRNGEVLPVKSFGYKGKRI
jgi:hypothetical protein